jgi:arylsulfatase A-like enzyme
MNGSRRAVRKTVAWIALSLAAGFLPACGDVGPAVGSRPNFVIFLVDDVAWDEVGFNGASEVPTPAIDGIAREGVVLTQFYVQPACTPTRGSLLTGRYAWRTGTEIRPTVWSQHGMLTDERTVAEVLREAGYATWIVGKWHLGGWQHAHLPLQRGFDHHYGFYGALVDSFTHLRREVLDWHRNGTPLLEEGYSTFLLADEASRLILDHEGDRPFFLYVALDAVHSPYQAPDDYVATYWKLGEKRALRLAELACMDAAIGRVLAALEERGIEEQTLVFFSSDNGGPGDDASAGPFRGGKGHYQEGGIRVPAALRWPGRIPAGSSSDEMLHVTDIFPTLAALAGAPLEGGLPLDGSNVWSTLAVDAPSPRREIVFSRDVLRRDDWKLIEEGASYYDWPAQPLQLYDVVRDPGEARNLASDHPEVVADLRVRLAAHRDEARPSESPSRIPGFPVVVYGERENEAHASQLRVPVRRLYDQSRRIHVPDWMRD